MTEEEYITVTTLQRIRDARQILHDTMPFGGDRLKQALRLVCEAEDEWAAKMGEVTE